jgi:DNA polymerase-3 subunit gamma/tau
LSLGDEQRGALAKQAAAAGLQTILAALQILAETKHRMKGATFSRVLLELALIRIGSLEQLDDLAELVGRLRQGQAGPGGPAVQSVTRVTSGPVKGVAAPGRSGDAAGPAMRQSAAEEQSARLDRAEPAGSSNSQPTTGKPTLSAEKVSALAQRPDSLVGDDDARLEPGNTVVPKEGIPFEAGRENEILSQVLLLLSDMAKSNAKNASSAAISGPNTLVLKFPKSYHFCKQFFEKSPDQLKRVEKAIEQVVGRPVSVSLAVDEVNAPVRDLANDVAQETSREAPRHVRPASSAGDNRPEAVTADDTSDARQDALVQRAISVFEARVVKTERGVAPPIEPAS